MGSGIARSASRWPHRRRLKNRRSPESIVGIPDDPPQPEIARLRAAHPSRASAAITRRNLTVLEHDYAETMVAPQVDRPRTRGDCAGQSRPCPFVSCSHHLYLDEQPHSEGFKVNFLHKEPWEMEETCALDVADRGGDTLEHVGALMNLTRKRIRQTEVVALAKLKAHVEELGETELFDLGD